MKNLQKGFAVPLLIGIIVLLVIGGGLYIYGNKKVEVPIVADNAVLQPTTTQAVNAPLNNLDNEGSFEITWPIEGSVLEAGRTYLIEWNGKDSRAKNYEIYLWKESEQLKQGRQGTGYVNVIASASNPVSVSNNSFSWTVPSTVKTGSDYQIDFSNVSAPQEARSKKFSIVNNNQTVAVKPSITVLYPNFDERLNNGGRDNIATIKWLSSGIGSSNIQIKLVNKANSQETMIAPNVPNTGSYNWKMDPTILRGEYKIKIVSDEASDSSDGYFMINTRSIIPGETFVTLVSPNGGETFTTGSKILIKWLSLGEKPTSATISLRSNARCPYGYSCTPLPNSFDNIAEIRGSDLDKGEFEWTVSKSNVDDHGYGYLIRILISKDNLGNASADDSDSKFSII